MDHTFPDSLFPLGASPAEGVRLTTDPCVSCEVRLWHVARFKSTHVSNGISWRSDDHIDNSRKHISGTNLRNRKWRPEDAGPFPFVKLCQHGYIMWHPLKRTRVKYRL